MSPSSEVLIEQEEILDIDPALICEYVITRSPTDRKLFSVYAVDNEGNLRYAAAVDVDFDTAAMDVEQLNSDLL